MFFSRLLAISVSRSVCLPAPVCLTRRTRPLSLCPCQIVPGALPPLLPRFPSRLPSTFENYSDAPLPSPPVSHTNTPLPPERGRGCPRAKLRHIQQTNQRRGGRGPAPGGRLRRGGASGKRPWPRPGHAPRPRAIKGQRSRRGPQPDFCDPTVGLNSMAFRATMDLSAIYEVSTG